MFEFINRIFAKGPVDDRSIITHEVANWRMSKKRRCMIEGVEYYEGKHDILNKQRTAIGEGGELTVINTLPNSRIIDNQYRKCVIQKANYLVGKPFTVNTANDTYTEILSEYFDKAFFRDIKRVAKGSLNCGVEWIAPLYDEQGVLQLKRFKGYEIIPEYKDAEHKVLESIIRMYDVQFYDGRTEKTITKVEYYNSEGIDFYEYSGGAVTPCAPFHQNYFSINGQAYNWDRIPFVPFRYNEEEKPLITCCKSLQDGLNTILSNFEDNMVEDMRNTILVLINYDGQNLGEFRRNLATYGTVKVKTVEGVTGDVKALQIEVNAENYKAIIDIFKNAIIENCMAFDAKEMKSGTPNQMNIQSMYSDTDLDASDMETEFQSALDDLLYFIDLDILYKGRGDFTAEKVDFVFNTDLPMDESAKINDLKNSVGLISNKTIVANHPLVTDVQAELDQMEEEKQQSMQEYNQAFQPQVNEGGGEDELLEQ